MMDRPISAAFALALCFLLNGCGVYLYEQYLTTWNGASFPFHDKPCRDCRYSYDMETGLKERVR